MKNRYSGLLPKVHLWTDVVLLNVSFLAAFFVRFDAFSDVPDNRYINLLLVGNLYGSYPPISLKPTSLIVYRIVLRVSLLTS